MEVQVKTLPDVRSDVKCRGSRSGGRSRGSPNSQHMSTTSKGAGYGPVTITFGVPVGEVGRGLRRPPFWILPKMPLPCHLLLKPPALIPLGTL